MAWHSKLSLNHKNVTYETGTATFLDIPVLTRKVWYAFCVSVNELYLRSINERVKQKYFRVSYSNHPLVHFPSISPYNISLNVTAPTVPALKFADGEGLLDSPAIAEYVERNYPRVPPSLAKPPPRKTANSFSIPMSRPVSAPAGLCRDVQEP